MRRIPRHTATGTRLPTWTRSGRADGDDDDEAGYSEDDHGEDENGAVSHSKRIQARSFNLTTGVVKRMESKEDGSLTATCQVDGNA